MKPIDPCALAYVERASYLRSIDTEVLGRCSMFDRPHQSLLRHALVSEDFSFELSDFGGYFENEEQRERLLRKAQNSEMLDVYLKSLSIKEQFEQLAYSEFYSVCLDLWSSLPTCSDLCKVVFGHSLGFGKFSFGEPYLFQGTTFRTISDSSLASIGGLEYFSFSLIERPREFFFQDQMIRLFALTLSHYADRGAPVGTFFDRKHEILIQELSKIGSDAKDPQRMFEITQKFMMHHELGHQLTCNAHSPIIEIIDALKISHRELPSVGFVTAGQKGAWRRLKAGQGTVSDMMFIMGDVLANFTVLSSGVTQKEIHALRAFHWWIIDRPKSTHFPRGHYIFLKYSELGDYESLFKIISQVLLLCHNAQSAKAAEIWLNMELSSWDWLAKQWSL